MENMRSIVTVLLLTSIIAIVFLCSFALRRRPTIGKPAIFLAFCGFCVVLYDFGYALEIHAQTLETVFFWVKFQHVGIQLLPPFWLLFALRIMGKGKWASPLASALLFVLPLGGLFCAFTLGDLNLMHPNARLATGEVLSLFKYDRGLVLYLVTAFQGLYLLSGFALFTVGLVKGKPVPRAQAAIYWLGSLVPWLSSLLYNVGLSPFNADLTPLALSVSVVLFLIGFLRLGILDITPVARNIVFEGLEEGVLVIDRNGCVTDKNESAVGILPALASADAGVSATEVLPDDPKLAKLLDPTPPTSAEFESGEGEGRRYYDVNYAPLKDPKGRNLGRLLTFHDVTEFKRLQAQLESMSIHDELTGLYNRRYLNEFAQEALERAARERSEFSIVMLDLDHFKDVNDTYGHTAGDLVLAAVAKTCRSSVRLGDIVGRLGGEEILVVMPRTSRDEAFEVAERIRRNIEANRVDSEGSIIGVTASFGVSSLCPYCSTFKDILITADMGLYEAKATGRNRVCLGRPRNAPETLPTS